jgi:hypothetical protein
VSAATPSLLRFCINYFFAFYGHRAPFRPCAGTFAARIWLRFLCLMFIVYWIWRLPTGTHRIYLRLALYRDVAWQHIGFGFDFLADSYFSIWAGGYTSLGRCVSGIERTGYFCGSACVYGRGFLHAGVFRAWDRDGFRFGSGNYNRV